MHGTRIGSRWGHKTVYTLCSTCVCAPPMLLCHYVIESTFVLATSELFITVTVHGDLS